MQRADNYHDSVVPRTQSLAKLLQLQQQPQLQQQQQQQQPASQQQQQQQQQQPPPQPQPQPQPKPLRFVTNYGAPHPKRRRIGAACMTCRKRKTACSGERPFCETCKQNNHECAGYSSDAPATATKRKTSDTPARNPSDLESRPLPAKAVRKKHRPDNATPITHSQTDPSRTTSVGQSPRPGGAKLPSPESGKDGEQAQKSLFSGPRNRMPYFRWLGPTAIMPGFKQMVVKVKRSDTDGGLRTSTDGEVRSPSLQNLPINERTVPSSIYSTTPAAVESDLRTPLNLPFYDTSPVPPSELITHLANTFFSHLGCNYPFLRRERFLKDLEEKQVDPVLVDAVCALAARFSTHSLLTQQTTSDGGEAVTPADYGHAFAQRAKHALTDTFPCPSVAAAQAALLLAYNEFGEQRDSGLWVYLGVAIRLAQDLGLHKLEGLRHIGRDGPTPKMVRQEQRVSAANPESSSPATSKSTETEAGVESSVESPETSPKEQKDMTEAIAVEQERVDTFWAIFFLDRVVSSGTGRRSTLRDKDIEISLPSLDQRHNKSDWPAPFPALIRIVHLYGRVADLLNSIKEPADITAETPKRLAAMESQVTNFYQNLSPRLFFDAVNFQHYMKAGEGTNFVLLHFWFHTLIILLHQPTLLKTFEGRMLQLFPNSQQLAMSSAKTIADIVSYAQLMDAKAPFGNPFTSQPIYIAACAFLRETVEQTATSNAQSRASSPNRTSNKHGTSDSAASSNEASRQASRKPSISSITASSPNPRESSTNAAEQRSRLGKHTLLATAASQHYQLCYKALQSMETYWAGAKYILTVLEQKFEGIGDPLLYTAEEGESSMEQPRPEPSFTSPGWRRKMSWGPYIANPAMQSPFWPPKAFGMVPGSPGESVDASKAIGWTITGNMNSNNPNLAWHFAREPGHSSRIDPRLGSFASEHEGSKNQSSSVGQYPKHLRASSTSSQRLASQDGMARQTVQPKYQSTSGPTSSDAENLLALSSPFHQAASGSSAANPMSSNFQQHPAHSLPQLAQPTNAHMDGAMHPPYSASVVHGDIPMQFMPGNMMIESQENVDMSMLGLEMMPWFEYPSHNMMHLFDPSHHSTGGSNHATG